MKSFIIAWIVTAVVFLALDSVWLSQVAPRFTRPIIGELLASNVRLAPAVAFYLMYVTGVVFLVVLPAQTGGVGSVVMRGAVLGAFAYATYDLTNQATLRVWSTALTLADIGWGALITALAAAAAAFAVSRSG